MTTHNSLQTTITINTIIHAPMELVWNCWTLPEHITQWCHASDDWEAPHAKNDVRIGGNFSTTMAAKDGSVHFEFTGTYTFVEPQKRIEYNIDRAPKETQHRHVVISFTPTHNGVHITETFDMEHENSEKLQRSGWQTILENFKNYTERYSALGSSR